MANQYSKVDDNEGNEVVEAIVLVVALMMNVVVINILMML